MTYYGSNAVVATAHWQANQPSYSYFVLRYSFGCSSVTKIANGHYRITFSSALSNDGYVVCGSMSAENSSSGSDTNVLRGSNGFHVLNHGTSSCDVIFAYGAYSGSNGNANHGEHHGVAFIEGS
tara:strand:- start:47 stop:418 length:372 start_codon:yes stop_codon:yes gene_type:complete